MRRIAIRDARPNMELAAPAYNDYGEMILDVGVSLNTEYMKLLIGKGVSRLIVEDSRVKDLILSPLIPQHVQADAVKAVFQMMKEARTGQPGAGVLAVQEAAYAMGRHIEESIVGEPDVMGCNLLKGYIYIHPVQSAIVAMILAKEAGYDHSDLLRAGEAAILQDIGYSLIPPQIIEKQGELTQEEDQILRRHS